MYSPEICRLVRRLRLSRGDMLWLAREVSEDRALPSVDCLSERQRGDLAEILRFLADPIDVHQYWAA